ncbi:MAG: C4-type zinc ribbon domain-containing protein [Actinomycetota bacterium]|nr:C4-type zinc ribbon domain-containing protein [Actinomycetota bacterium]
MTADTLSSEAQLRLLDLQAADTFLAQQAHRRSTLPEIAAIAERDERSAALHNEVVDTETQIGDIAGEQRRLENEVEAVRTRAARDEQRLVVGGLPAKDLAGLQHEITTLARRQSTLEDELLEVMEQREQADGSLALLVAQRIVLEGERRELAASRDAVFAQVDAAAAERRIERDAIAAELPEDLLALYERAREHGGGVGAAVLRQRRCEGCRIELSGSELASVRRAGPDEVVRCDNCRRVLVRTTESGL